MNATTGSILSLAIVGLLAIGCTAPGYSARPSAPAPELPAAAAIAIVRIPTPWYAPRFVVRKKFVSALPEYEALAPLRAKYFTIADTGEFGGVYLWDGRRAADDHFDAAWRERIRRTRGAEPDVLILDVPFAIEGPALPHGEPVGARSLEYPAWASYARWELPDAIDPREGARTLARSTSAGSALIRAFVVTGPHFVGLVSLWANRHAAEVAVEDRSRAAVARDLGARLGPTVLFEAPVLMDATLRGPRRAALLPPR